MIDRMKRIIWEYHNGNITISVTNIDEDYMIEVFGEMGRQMCLRLHKKDIRLMTEAIMSDVNAVKVD
jgi:hypothetical protein